VDTITANQPEGPPVFVDNRADARRFFVQVRRKFCNSQALEPLEQLVLDVISAHPEYHAVLDRGEDSLDEDYVPRHGRTNPFLHMSLHVAIREQIQADRPAGIRGLCERLAEKCGDRHEMEHRVMGCLGETLWQAQRQNRMPDELAYLDNVRKLL